MRSIHEKIQILEEKYSYTLAYATFLEEKMNLPEKALEKLKDVFDDQYYSTEEYYENYT